jgi:putative ABC transport system permease protein
MGMTGLPPGAVMQVSLTVNDVKDLDYAQGEVESLLRQRHRIKPGEEDDFSVRNIAQIVRHATKPPALCRGCWARWRRSRCWSAASAS